MSNYSELIDRVRRNQSCTNKKNLIQTSASQLQKLQQIVNNHKNNSEIEFVNNEIYKIRKKFIIDEQFLNRLSLKIEIKKIFYKQINKVNELGNDL